MHTNIHHTQQHRRHRHEPVLLEQVLKYLAPKPGESYLDLTAGYGGHAQAISELTNQPTKMTLVDRDENAARVLKQLFGAKVQIIGSDFLAAAQSLSRDRRTFDLILMDLGVSSPHLDKAERGFSIKRDGPLDMRMDQNQDLSAAQIVNDWTQTDLVEILKNYGEEPQAKLIASAIVAARPIESTGELANVVSQAVKRPAKNRIHPATRTFQAIRIAVNDELGQLEQTLKLLPDLLASNGRMAIISFHSLEDRLVKQFLKEEASSGFEARLKLLTKKPVLGETKDVHNPRARSAKLRAAVKIKTERETHAN